MPKTRVGKSWIVNLSLRNLASSTQGWEETGGTNRIFRAVEIHRIFCKDALIMAPCPKTQNAHQQQTLTYGLW